MTRKLPLLFLAIPLSAGARSPLFNILGSYFPGWMLCILVAILLTVLLRLFARRLKFDGYMEPVVVTYPALAIFFSFTLWLLLFA